MTACLLVTGQALLESKVKGKFEIFSKDALY